MDLARKNPSGFQKDAVSELGGRNLITTYNNRTYKVRHPHFAKVPNDL